MMAVAAWIVWRKSSHRLNTPALRLFVVQLVLNAAWSPLFFGAHNIPLAAVDLGLLWVAVLMTVIAFFRVSRLAGGLLVPYQLWITFAAALNMAILRLN